MLILYETPAGYSLFKVNDSKKLKKLEADDIHDALFADKASATSSLELVSFQAFADTADAVAAIAACQEGRAGTALQQFLSKKLKKILKTTKANGKKLQLAVADKALAVSLQQGDRVGKKSSSWPEEVQLVNDDKTAELFRGIRCYMDDLLGEADSENGGAAASINASDMRKMQLGLAHALGRYKLKFSADKVDTMIIQAVGLLDELDKEINTYAMRVKEWYGWHFPELQALAADNTTYAKLVLAAGHRHKLKETDLSSVFDADVDASAESNANIIKEAAEISMGTDITDNDVLNIQALAEQVLSLTEYRAQLFEYLKNRMNAIAPNLTILTGELVGARLIAHAGSLLNLAKQPASTVQILGAEKALFRALKTKHDTPKYGLIYHASLIGQAAPAHKGKISRVLAAKASLAIRVDALSDDTADADGNPGQQSIDTTVGYEGRAKVEARLRQLDGKTNGTSAAAVVGATNLKAQKTAKYDPVAAKTASAKVMYNSASDVMQLDDPIDAENDQESKKKDKKEKKEKKRKSKSGGDDDEEDDAKPKAKDKSESSEKKKKRKLAEKESSGKSDKDDDDEGDNADKKSAKKAKKEKRKS